MSTSGPPIRSGTRDRDRTGIAQIEPASFTPEELFSNAKPCGVNRVVLIQMSFYGFDNSFMLDAIRKYKGTFRGVAVIDETVPDVSRKMRELAALGVRGFRISPRDQPTDLARFARHGGHVEECG